MIYNDEILTRIQNEYEILRAKAAQEKNARVEAAWQKAPRLREIKTEINTLGARHTVNMLKNPKNSAELTAEFQRSIHALEDERRKVMRENSIPEDYDKCVYQCKLCSDTGYVGNKKCRCYEQKLINALYNTSNLGELLNKQNFDTFDFEMYSKEIKPDGKISVYTYMHNIYEKCRLFCENFDNEPRGFLFYGTSGLGKTFLSSCIAKDLMDKGRSVVYAKATRLFSMYEDYKFGRIKPETARALIDGVYSADLLIIDDLGTENVNKTSVSFLFDILNERAINGKKMIISTNYSMSALTEIYSYRFTSRMYEFFNPVHFIGGNDQDIRVKQRKKED